MAKWYTFLQDQLLQSLCKKSVVDFLIGQVNLKVEPHFMPNLLVELILSWRIPLYFLRRSNFGFPLQSYVCHMQNYMEEACCMWASIEMYVLSDLALSLFVFYMIEINCSLCGGVQSFLVVHTFYQYLLFQFLSIVGAVSGLQCTVDFFFSSELFVSYVISSSQWSIWNHGQWFPVLKL